MCSRTNVTVIFHLKSKIVVLLVYVWRCASVLSVLCNWAVSEKHVLILKYESMNEIQNTEKNDFKQYFMHIYVIQSTEQKHTNWTTRATKPELPTVWMKTTLLFFSGKVASSSSGLRDDIATITRWVDDESTSTTELRRLWIMRRRGSEEECLRPWKKLLKILAAERLRGEPCMTDQPQWQCSRVLRMRWSNTPVVPCRSCRDVQHPPRSGSQEAGAELSP